MRCVCLTGTIASGKSTAAAFFEKQGIDRIDADRIAKNLTAQGTAAYHEIYDHFGPNLFLANGDLNRRALRDCIFQHPKERTWLESLLHPLIRQAIVEQIKQCTSPYCIIEIPLLKQRSDYPYLDRVLLITAEEDVKIQRLMARDQCSKEHALAILKQQPSEEAYRLLADDIIHNQGNMEHFYEQLMLLDQTYRHL